MYMLELQAFLRKVSQMIINQSNPDCVTAPGPRPSPPPPQVFSTPDALAPLAFHFLDDPLPGLGSCWVSIIVSFANLHYLPPPQNL